MQVLQKVRYEMIVEQLNCCCASPKKAFGLINH